MPAKKAQTTSGSGKLKLVHSKATPINWSEFFTPLDDRVLIQLIGESDRTPGGLYIPQMAEEKPQRGHVLAVGRGRMDKKGRIRPLDVTLGDEVIFAKFAGTALEMGSGEALLLREDEIIAVVK